MPESKDIKIFLADIERSISEIFDFLPEKWLIIVKYLPNLEKHVKELRDTMRKSEEWLSNA